MCWHSPETSVCPCCHGGAQPGGETPQNFLGEVGRLLPGLSQEGKQP